MTLLEAWKKDIEEVYEKVNLIIKKYLDIFISKQRNIVDDIKYNYKTYVSEIEYDLWNFLKKEEKTINGIQNWKVYRYAADFSKEMKS